MKQILTFFLVISTTFAFAYRPSATQEQVTAFFSTKTYIIKQDDLLGEYNSFMQKALKENWDLTKYEFITMEEFETKRLDEKNSFILMSQLNFPGDRVLASYDYISIIMGGNYDDIDIMPELCSFPLAYTDNSDKSMAHIPAIISFMVQHIKNMKTNPKLLKDRRYKFYTNQKKTIAKGTIHLILEEQTKSFNTDKKIKVIYAGKVTFVDEAFIKSAIERKDKSVLFLHKISSEENFPGTRCFTIIMGADGTLYYWKFHELTGHTNNGLTENEWKNFNKHKN